MMHKALCPTIVLMLCLSASLSAQTLRVRHDHDPWGSCEGELEITDTGIHFRPAEGDHERNWEWIDIQGFDRASPEIFSILTYEDLKWHFGLDRAFDFTILTGEDVLEDALFSRIRDQLARPVVDRVARTITPEYQVAVKHIHLFGGCEGVLIFGKEWVVYQTDHSEDARTWRRDRDIANVWSSNRFELELRVLEENRRAFDKTTRFTFQLKEPLDEDYYAQLRREFLLAR